MIGALPTCDACGKPHRISLTVEPSKHRRSDPPLTLCVACWKEPEALERVKP